jgi:hypothetical protein
MDTACAAFERGMQLEPFRHNPISLCFDAREDVLHLVLM